VPILHARRERIDATTTPHEADEVLEVSRCKVLDPASGCGNFPAIGYRELLHLTAQAVDRRDRLYATSGVTPPDKTPY